MEELLEVNPGLKSRFSQRLFFPDFTVKDAVQLYRKRLDQEYGLGLTPGAEEALPGLMVQVGGRGQGWLSEGAGIQDGWRKGVICCTGERCQAPQCYACDAWSMQVLAFDAGG